MHKNIFIKKLVFFYSSFVAETQYFFVNKSSKTWIHLKSNPSSSDRSELIINFERIKLEGISIVWSLDLLFDIFLTASQSEDLFSATISRKHLNYAWISALSEAVLVTDIYLNNFFHKLMVKKRSNFFLYL